MKIGDWLSWYRDVGWKGKQLIAGPVVRLTRTQAVIKAMTANGETFEARVRRDTLDRVGVKGPCRVFATPTTQAAAEAVWAKEAADRILDTWRSELADVRWMDLPDDATRELHWVARQMGVLPKGGATCPA